MFENYYFKTILRFSVDIALPFQSTVMTSWASILFYEMPPAQGKPVRRGLVLVW
jgi:hypothetical protein